MLLGPPNGVDDTAEIEAAAATASALQFGDGLYHCDECL